MLSSSLLAFHLLNNVFKGCSGSSTQRILQKKFPAKLHSIITCDLFLPNTVFVPPKKSPKQRKLEKKVAAEISDCLNYCIH